MGGHQSFEARPSSQWIDGALGVRHRLSSFYDPSSADSELLRLHRSTDNASEVSRNLGISAASRVLRDVFAEFDSYVLRLSDQRIVEYRDIRPHDRLHADVFVESHEGLDYSDTFDVRVVFTDPIGAMVFSCFATYVGTQDVVAEELAEPRTEPAPASDSSGIAVSS